MKGKRLLAAFSLAAAFVVGLTGCSSSSEHQQETVRQEYIENDNENGKENGEKGEDARQSQNVAETAGLDGITSFDIKAKYGTADSIEIAPFYNVQQDTAFLFHFNSSVNPVSAITVHTDAKCQQDSMVYQINDGYHTDDGMDVVVKPGEPVLNAGKEKLENYNWGYAPIYYLCIRYDLESEKVQKLENPVIVPFTVKAKVSTPNVSSCVNTQGQFEIQWDKVTDAVSYNIYEASGTKEISETEGLCRAECAYIGDHLNLLASVDAEQNSFCDFHCDGTGNTLVLENGYVSQENFYDVGTYYVTAVDKDGNESLFSFPAEGKQFKANLPKSFDNQSVFQMSDGAATVLPESVPVKMADGSSVSFPISYRKLSMENGCASYEYAIAGTMLKGLIKYMAEDGQYKDEILSSLKLETAAYQMNNTIRIIPENTINTSQSGYAVLCTVSDYPKNGSKAEYSQDIYYKRADMEAARVVRDGKYPEGAEPLGIFTNGQDETISRKDMECSSTSSFGGVPENKNNDCYETEFMIFADSAEEEYLAICMSDAAEEISLADFPKLQNMEYLSDVVYKVIYQNPYIMGVDSFGYDADAGVLYVTYTEEKKIIKEKQNKVKAEAESIISQITDKEMSDEDKVFAVWNYLEASTVYNHAACEAAAANGFKDMAGYNDSFTVYGIICEKTGVCQSYMYAVKLLCQMAGVECRSLTGYIQNNLPHGWNAVMLDGQWYWLDATNAEQNSGVPYFIYQTSSEFAADSWNYVLNDEYALDNELAFAETENMDKDWYAAKGLFAENHQEILDIIRDKIAECNGTLYIKCTFIPSVNDTEFVKGIGQALADCGYSDSEISNTRFGNAGQVMVIDMTGVEVGK